MHLDGPTSTIETSLQVSSVISYAMAHNRIAVVDEIVVESQADVRGADLVVEITDVSGVLTRPCRRMVDLSSRARTVVDDLRLQLDPTRMSDVTERRP